MTHFEITKGNSPVVLGLPHTGTHVPEDVFKRLNEEGRLLRDTDWFVHELYDGLLDGATTVRATTHRYVIDVNRDPSGQSLYPGQNTTELVPTTTFDGVGIWRRGEAPETAETEERVAAFHAPYHAALAAEIERVRALHGVAILYDCHSIRSHVPHLFEGRLPDLNIGTNDGKACDARVEAAVRRIAEDSSFTSVVNGRFKGGWTTRHHGRPQDGVHAIQMELAQATHLASETPPFTLDAARAEPLRTTLRGILRALAELAPQLR